MACKSGCCRPSELVISAACAHENQPDDDSCCDDDDCCADSCVNGEGSQKPNQPDRRLSTGGCCESESKTTVENEYCSASPNFVTNNACCDGCTMGPSGDMDCRAQNTATADDCCSGSPEDSEADCGNDCCAQQSVAEELRCPNLPANSKAGYKKVCCAEEAASEDCCSESSGSSETGCNKGCCSSQKPPAADKLPVPSCCQGKAFPCCDESCLDRLALRECQSHAETCSTALCDGRKHDIPCASHTRKTRKTYAARLEALGCICRALVALGLESCCAGPKPALRKGSCSSREMSPASARSSACRSSCADANCVKKRRGQNKRHGRTDIKATVDACRDKETASITSSCNDSCCDKQRPPAKVVIKTSHPVNPVPALADLEKGLQDADKEHIILAISGMTCTGCETKLNRAFAPLPVIKNLKTSLVLSRAEFDLVGGASLDEVIKHVERTTEFKCERVTNQGSSLDLIAPGGDADTFINQPWPKGVIDMKVVDRGIVNVCFEPKIIGARDLVEKGWESGHIRLAAPRTDPTVDAGSKHVRHLGYMTVFSAVLTIPVLVMAWAPLPEHEIAYGSASLALASIIQLIVAGPFYPKALKSLVFTRVIEMDLLIVLSTSAAYIFSIVSFGYLVAGHPLSTGEFFETSTLLVTLIMVGRYVAALARQKAVESISIRSLQTSTAVLVTQDGQMEIDARLLQYGDIFKVVPDSKIPTDGTVISGESEVDESMMTGESTPVTKQVKSTVIAGSVNGSGALVVRLTRLPGDNTISTIASMVDAAKLSKPKVQHLADRVASYFVPVVVALTIITLVIWIAVGIDIRGQSGTDAAIKAITYAITVLIVSCPCAIGLAVPMVIVIASGVAAERGVIFKSSEAIEKAYKASHVVFDKTGTLTEGRLRVEHELYVGEDHEHVKSQLLGLVASIKHPVSVAVAKHLMEQGEIACPIPESKALAGRGVEGTTPSGVTLRAGNARWLALESDPRVQTVLSRGYTAFCFTINGTMAAVFGLEDLVRPDAASTVSVLLERGIAVHILSGDDDGPVRSVAAQLHVEETNIRSRCTPGEKQAYIRSLIAQNPKDIIMFCGDGTNDAVALAQATIGVHMNHDSGTDVAKSAADIVLMRPSLSGILTIINVSRKSMRRIMFNFGWSFVYNLFAILLGAGAFVSVRIPPEFAGLGELVSVLPVIAAALVLRWEKI